MIALIAVSPLEAAQSQPRPSKENEETTRAGQQPAPDQRGTDYRPWVVEIKPRPPTDPESAKEKRQEQQQSSDRQWIRGVAVVTIVVALMQWWLIRRQARISDEQRDLMARQNAIIIGSSERLTRLFMLPEQMLDFAMQIELDRMQILFLKQGEPAAGALVLEGQNLPTDATMCLWLAGEIHYRDRFGRLHWYGYATRWDRHADRFVFDPSVADLNYDRLMTADEIKTRAYES